MITMKASMSISKGKGSIRHNTREFKAKNVDHERSDSNVVVVSEPIKQVYNKLFGESLDKYNEKQTRNDRKIKSYYDHIRHSRQEKPFYELIVQVGNQYNADKLNEVVEEILPKFVEICKEKYPNVYIFGAYVHLDESTPHLHLDYIPIAKNQKRGLETRNSHNLAMKQMGYSDYRDFRADMMTELVELCKKYGVERDILHNWSKHADIETFKKIGMEANKMVDSIKKEVDQELEQHTLTMLRPSEVKKKDRLEYMAQLFTENHELYKKVLLQEKQLQTYMTLDEIKQEVEDKPIHLENAKLKIENNELKKQVESKTKENISLKDQILHFKEVFTTTCQILSRIFKIPHNSILDVFKEVKNILDKDRMDDFDKKQDLDYLVYKETGELPHEQEEELEEELDFTKE